MSDDDAQLSFQYRWSRNDSIISRTYTDVSSVELDFNIFAIGIPKFLHRNFELNQQKYHICSFSLSDLIVKVSFSISLSVFWKMYIFVIFIKVVNDFRSVSDEL